MKIFNWFKKKKIHSDSDLDFCVAKGILTNEEKLRIERDRAIERWKKEVLNRRKKK